MDQGIRKILTKLTTGVTNDHYLVTERSLIMTGKNVVRVQGVGFLV